MLLNYYQSLTIEGFSLKRAKCNKKSSVYHHPGTMALCLLKASQRRMVKELTYCPVYWIDSIHR